MALSREITAQIKDLLEKNPQGLSITDIVKSISINRNTAGRYLESLLVSGQVEMRHFGMAKIYSLSERLPLSSVLSISSECVMQLDSSLRIIYINAPLERLLGVANKEILGKNIEYTVIPRILDDAYPRVVSRLREGVSGSEYHGELDIPSLERIFLCRIVPIVNADGQKGVSALLEDITSRKHDEERLRKSETQYRVLAEASRDLIFLISRDDTIEYVNSFAAAFLGRRVDELVGRPRHAFIPEKISRIQREQLEQVFRTGMMIRSEGPLSRDNVPRWFDHVLVPLTDRNGVVQSVLGISRDITERKHAEEALFSSRQMLQLVLDTVPARVFWKDRNLVFLGCNRTLALDAGFKEPAEVIGKTDYELASSATADRYRSDDREVMETGKPKLNFEEPQIRQDGSRAWLRTSKAPLRDRDGNVIGVLGTYEDITESRRAEKALQESEKRLRSLLGAAPAGIGIVRDRIFQEVNDRFLEMTGYLPHEIIGKSARILYPTTEDFEHVGKEKYRQMEERGSGIVETPWRRKDGAVITVLLSSTYLDPEDPGAGLTFAALDITAEKKMQADLREREQQYRFIVDNSLDIITRQTPTCVCTYVSPSVTPILGYSVEESIGFSLLALVHPGDISRVQEELHAIIGNGSSNATTMFRFRHRDGRYLWFESMINVIRNERTGEVREFLSISREITARKQSEETARRRDRVLHAFGAASGYLLTGRIRNPLPRVLATMGEAVDADAAYIYQDHQDPANGTHIAERKVRWTKDPARDPGHSRDCRNLFPVQWSERLASGTWIAGPRDRFAPSDREMMDLMGIQSILIVPIHVTGAYWGFIGCSDLHAEHDWADAEIEILMTLAATIGLVLERRDLEVISG